MLTAPELEEAVLTKGDVEGRVFEQTTPDVATADQVRVDKAVCEPLAHAVSGAALGRPAAIVSRTVILELAEHPAEGGGLTSTRMARFLDSDVASAVNGGDFPFATAVIDAQVAKLG